MEGLYIVLAIIAVVVVVFAGMAILLPYLAKKGVSLPGMISGANSVLSTAGVIMDGLSGVFPDNGAFKLIDKIIGYAEQAAKSAEQLYQASKIESHMRNEEAAKLVYNMLEASDIELTDAVKQIVAGCIEAAVFALPKTHADA